MLKLTPYEDSLDQDEPASLLFPADAVRLLGTDLPLAPRSRGRGREHAFDPLRHAEDALQRVESDFARLRAQFDGSDDRPRAA